MGVNDDIADWMLRRNLHLNDLDDARMREVTRFFNDTVFPDIGRKLADFPEGRYIRRIEKLKYTRKAIKEGLPFDRWSRETLEQLKDAGIAETEIIADEISQRLPMNLQLYAPAPQVVEEVMFSKPFQGELMKDWFGRLEPNLQENIYRDFRAGIIEGEPLKDIGEQVLEGSYTAFTAGRRKAVHNARAVVRTASTAIHNRARETTYSANQEVIKGVQYLATLDTRTTLICMNLHGEVFPIGEGERPPQHYNCRSTTVPVTKSWQELGLEGDDLTQDTMASMDGQVAGVDKDFGKWIDTLSDENQDKSLGPVRAELWRTGKVNDLADFMATTTRVKTLREMGFNQAGNALEETVEEVTAGGIVNMKELKEEMLNDTGNNSVEKLYSYDENGNRTFEKLGVENAVPLEHSEFAQIYDDAVVIHNHPNSSFFSEDDIKMAMKGNHKEIRVFVPNSVSGDGYYYLKQPEDGWKSILGDWVDDVNPSEDLSASYRFDLKYDSSRIRGEIRQAEQRVFEKAKIEMGGDIYDDFDKYEKLYRKYRPEEYKKIDLIGDLFGFEEI